MRLNKIQSQAIKDAFSLYLQNFELRLFGSRIYDDKNGGDIDLLVLTNNRLTLNEKWKIRREIEKNLGPQKIDIVNFTFNQEDEFKNYILGESIIL